MTKNSELKARIQKRNAIGVRGREAVQMLEKLFEHCDSSCIDLENPDLVYGELLMLERVWQALKDVLPTAETDKLYSKLDEYLESVRHTIMKDYDDNVADIGA